VHVEKFREHKRERYLTTEELSRLSATLTSLDETRTELPSVIAAIRLLIATGCRMSEILTLRWDFVNFERRRFELPDSKTGAKRLPLNGLALEILSRIERGPDNPYVIVGAKDGEHLVNLEKPWRRIRKLAGLKDVRIHDLRHTFASLAAGLGEGLPMIGKLLGHTQAQTTHRYAHLADDPVVAASDRIGSAIEKVMNHHRQE